ncbi:MAG: O-antigen ligase family protein, partial [Acidobacteriota bacterium]|nr:O-antigen ligase family protein [Acidobacteriota bacterium]
SEQQRQISKNSDWYDAKLVADKPSRLSAVIFFSLLAGGILAVIVFGAADVWALGLMSLLVGAIVVLWLVDSWRNEVFFFNTNPMQISLLGLVLIGLIQLLPLGNSAVSTDLLGVPAVNTLSLAPYLTRFAIVQLVVYLVFFAAALTFINNQKRLRKAVVTVIIFGALMAFFGILQRLANVDGIYGARKTSEAVTFASYVNQNHFAALMEMTIGLTLALLFGNATNKDKRIFLIAAAAVMGIAIVFTGSRGGLVSLLAVLGFIVAANLLKRQDDGENVSEDGEKRSNFRRNLAYIVGGLTVIFGLFGAAIMLGADESLIRGVGLTANEQDVSHGRTHFWNTALKIISDYPILGTGLDSFGVTFTRYDTWNGIWRVEQAHNDYLQILADAGILGFICVLSFIFLLFKQSLRIIGKTSDNFRRSTAIGGLAGCFGIIVYSFFDFPLRTPANGYFFLLFAVLATATINYPKLYRKRK